MNEKEKNKVISIRDCLVQNKYIKDKIKKNEDRFNLDDDSIKIIDEYNELPEITLTQLHEAEELTQWLNKNIKPKNILEVLYREKINNETLSEKLETYLKDNDCKCCKVYTDSTILVFEYEKYDRTTPKKVLKLFDLDYDLIKYKAIYTTRNNCEKSKNYFLWEDIRKRWLGE